ncbi:hypothetical protein Hypma_007427 [Hypsizygus marmoreus]|uniref:ABM domain-containing protein n=1 Tax=Hypsizygus marmoreus TaxID=39966 RepID=A0A369K2H5_HYPMA|nr:hypothetical protein Hypma_007427 [Hypsizygus marmoreus]
MTPSSSSEKSFNDWYEDEHIPLLSGVPGWLDSGRYRLTISTTSHAPSYVALHRWTDLAAFDTAEYKTATNTAWRTTVMEKVVKKERFLLQYKGELCNILDTLL